MADNTASVKLGVIKPTRESKSREDLAGLLPANIEMIPEYLGFAYKSLDEFRQAMPIYDNFVDSLAAQGCDLIHPEGAPPFMLQGLAAETRYIEQWQARHGVPVFTTGSTQVAAMRALGIERFVGYTPFIGELAEAFHKYFTDAGFTVLSMGKPVGDEESVYDLSTAEIVARIAESFAKEAGDPQALYILGSDWPVFDVIEEVEAAIGVPMLHPVTVRAWYILTELGQNTPIAGHGRLLAAMPPFAA